MDKKILKNIAKEIVKAKNIAIFHHIHPDGDSFSCSYGLLLAIKQKFPNKNVVLVSNEENFCNHFFSKEIRKEYFVSSIDSKYLSIVGDTALKERIFLFEEFDKGYKKICFDHHKSFNISKNNLLYWSESLMIASSIQAYMIVKKLRVKLNEEIAFSLMIGLVTDSGQFSFSASDTIVLEIYTYLLKFISNEKMNYFYNRMKQKTKLDLEISKIIFSNIQFSKKVSYIIFKKNIIEKYGRENIKQKINLIGNIESYPIWMIILEKIKNADNFNYDLSIRSNGPIINDLPSDFIGGGHDKASSYKIKSIEDLEKILFFLDKK